MILTKSIGTARSSGVTASCPRPVWYISQPVQTFELGQIQQGVLAVLVWKAPCSPTIQVSEAVLMLLL
jgi:hypothetical protein